MPPNQTPDLPELWLLSDERNDAVLEDALERLPRGSGFIFRHYHLPPAGRRARFDALLRIVRRDGHLAILSGSAANARRWGADGLYGLPARMRGAAGLLRLATAHDLPELRAAERAGADAALLSPVFPTRSHGGARALGPLRFCLLASKARIPVIALGGMTRERARRLDWPRWAAIDGLSSRSLR